MTFWLSKGPLYTLAATASATLLLLLLLVPLLLLHACAPMRAHMSRPVGRGGTGPQRIGQRVGVGEHGSVL